MPTPKLNYVLISLRLKSNYDVISGTKTINDRQLSRQKIGQKISIIKTISFEWELLTFDDIKKIVHFGILIHVMS